MLRVLFGTRELLILLIASILLGLVAAFVMPFMSMFGTRELGMSPLSFGVFMTVTSTSAVVASTVISRWSDAGLSRKAVLVGGSLSGTVGYLGYAYFRDPLVLTAIGSIFLGLSSATFPQLFACARDALARAEVPKRDVPLYMNVLRSCFALSWTAGPAIAAWIMARHSFRGTFLAAGGFLLVFALLVLFLLPAGRVAASSASEEQAPQPVVPLLGVLRQPVVLAHFCGFFLYFVCSTMGMLNLPLLVLSTLSGSEQQVGLIYSIAPCFELPLMFYVGVLAARLDHARMIRVALVLAVGYYALLAVAQSPSQIYAIQVLSAAIVSVTGGLAITFFQNLLPDQPGTATNLYSNAQRLGSMAGNLGFGVIAATFGYRVVFGACAGLCLVSVTLLTLFRPPATEFA